jgi:hypothetical protein
LTTKVDFCHILFTTMPMALFFYLILIIQKMFNLETDDLALKPYIPQKKNTSMNLLQMSCVIT